MDGIYGTRLLLEALAMRLTLLALAPEFVEQAGRLLDELEELGGPATGEAWHRAHHEFYQTFMTSAQGLLFEQIVSYAQRSERYMYAEAHAPALLHARRAAEHRQIKGSAEHDLCHGDDSSSRRRRNRAETASPGG